MKQQYHNIMFVLALVLVLLTAACGDDAEPDDTIDFATGDFVISTDVVDDQCLDGGLNLLFMPNGTDTPWAWPFPVTLYAESALPSEYVIQLREPFGELSVTARDAGENAQQITADKNVGVLLGESQFGQCVVDIDAVVDIAYTSGNAATGIAALELSNPRGDDQCPVDMPDKCNVFLSFTAERQ